MGKNKKGRGQGQGQGVSQISTTSPSPSTPQNLQSDPTNLSPRMQKKLARMEKGSSKFKEKLEMYDMIAANLLAGNSIIEPEQDLTASQIHIGFSNISSQTQVSKYFLIRGFPDYLRPYLIDQIRSTCINDGVKINSSFYCEPYKIDWNSAEMRNKLSIWERYAEDESYGDTSVFRYRNNRNDSLAKRRIIESTKYLNQAELDYKRNTMRVLFLIEFSAHRDSESLYNLSESIKTFKAMCSSSDIKIKDLRINLIDWLKALAPFSLKSTREIENKLPRKIVTDDILANFNSYKQGRVGTTGVPLGTDVLSGVPVMKKFKENPDAAENWIIAGETGGGKSLFVKSLITYLLADNFVITVLDYEGDEYENIANYLRAGNRDDVKVVSMGKGSTTYFDPCEIPRLTGDPDVDNDLKECASGYILSIFRVIACGLDGEMTQWEERVISTAIQRMYDSAGVTDDKSTWTRSSGLRLSDVYEELKQMVDSKELVDVDNDNIKHKAAVKIQEAASIYFEPGEVKSGTFANPMPADDLYKARFIIFSFGMKGAASMLTDPTILALKQLSVAYITIQISNYCKYVKHCFNVKVWEEFQRWGNVTGSADVIGNAMTGGRKRGDVNLLLTNDLAAMLDTNNKLNEKISQNIQNYAIGRITVRSVREKFCDLFDLQDCQKAIDKIASAYTTSPVQSGNAMQAGSRYMYSFCIILDNGKKAIAKVLLPPAIANSTLFKTGVSVGKPRETLK